MPNKKGTSRTGGIGSGGWINVPKSYRYSFPKGIVEKSRSGNFRIARRFSKEEMKYQPFSALNAGRRGIGYISGRDFSKHLFSIREKLSINSQNFAVIVSLRAIKVFQDSFKYKRFYSDGGDKWPDLDEKTVKKRIRKNTWPGAGGMLREYGDMFESISTTARNNKSGVTKGVRIFTDPSKYNGHIYYDKRGGVHKDGSGFFCYAGLHNEGGRIRGGHKLPKRQFIGHSTYLLDFAFKQADKYLFFNVFD